MKLGIYGRASGELGDTGQDVRAQVVEVAAGVEARGHVAVTRAAWLDDGVSGDSNAFNREGFAELLAAYARGEIDGIAFKEASRITREKPWLGLDRFDVLEGRGVPYLSLAEPDFDTVTRPPDVERETTRAWPRFAILWASWHELLTIRRRTGEKMAAFKKGTSTPKAPVGRPRVEVEPAHLEEARAVIGRGGSLTDARERVRVLRGYYSVKDSEAKKARDVGKGTLGRALGLPGYVRPAQNTDRPKTPEAPASEGPAVNGSVLGEGSP